MNIKLIVLAILGSMLVGCRTPQSAPDTTPASFASIKHILEKNCVHCHGSQRLANMPSMESTLSLDAMISSRAWIIPGQPEHSRLLQVVTLADNQPGAMPPTGHAVAASEIAALRSWILAGAVIPKDARGSLTPRGEAPRSR